jgi:hypothetical protein
LRSRRIGIAPAQRPQDMEQAAELHDDDDRARDEKRDVAGYLDDDPLPVRERFRNVRNPC